MASVMFVLHELFTAEPLPSEPYPLTHEVAILLFRMKGFVSNQGISELLSALGYTHNSTGHISQKLNQMGGALSNTLQIAIQAHHYILWSGGGRMMADYPHDSGRSPYTSLSGYRLATSAPLLANQREKTQVSSK